MILKLKAGIIVKIPHLNGKSEEDANNFFKKLEGSDGYNMHKIEDDWYLERPSTDISSLDEPNNTVASSCNLSGLQDFADKTIDVLETIEPKYYKNLVNWCNPQAYFFVGDWKNIEIAYKHLLSL